MVNAKTFKNLGANKWNEIVVMDKVVNLYSKDVNANYFCLVNDCAMEFAKSLPLEEKLLHLPAIEKYFLQAMNDYSTQYRSVEEFTNDVFTEYMVGLCYENFNVIAYNVAVKLIKDKFTAKYSSMSDEALDCIINNLVNFVKDEEEWGTKLEAKL